MRAFIGKDGPGGDAIELLTRLLVCIALVWTELGGRCVPLGVDLVLQGLYDQSLFLEALQLLLFGDFNLLDGYLLCVVD